MLKWCFISQQRTKPTALKGNDTHYRGAATDTFFHCKLLRTSAVKVVDEFPL